MARPGARIRITTDALAEIRQLAQRAWRRGCETCFYLFARPDGAINRVVRAGDPEEYTAMTRPDTVAATTLVARMHRDGLVMVGEGHVHRGYPGPSRGDLATARNVALEQGRPGFLCLVANMTAPDAAPDLTAHSVGADGTLYEHQLAEAVERPAYEPLIPHDRQRRRYVQYGLGSGGSMVALQSASWGLSRVTYVDHDTLEPRNSARHLAPRRAAGTKKTTWTRRFLTPRTTSEIRTYAKEVTPRNQSWLRKLVREHDVVADCTGHPVVRELISEACKTIGRPLVTAGVFAKAAGGYVFVQGPEPTAACNRCLFKLTTHSQRDDAETLDQLTRDYGFTSQELNAQLGLFTDVNVTAALQAKVLLDVIKGVQHDANLYLIDNQAITVRSVRIQQSKTCTTCNHE